jgi:hypothetical protein
MMDAALMARAAGAFNRYLCKWFLLAKRRIG